MRNKLYSWGKRRIRTTGWPVGQLKLLPRKLQTVHQRNVLVLPVLGLFIVLGVYLLLTTHAATPGISLETENGTASAGATTINDSTASGGNAVKFGSDLAVPTGLHAVTGGPSIALMWDASAASNISYAVYRNGTQIATVAPDSSNPIPVYRAGNRYIDGSITKGSTYSYQLQAMDASSGQKSALSTALSVKAPSSTTPTPTITTDATAAPDLAAWLNNTVVPELRIWYPKEADYLAFPAYTPPASFKLVFVNGQANPAEAHWDIGEIHLSTDWYRAHPADLSSIIHECAHVVQDDSGTYYPSWIIEGTASWTSHKLYEDDSQFGPMQPPSQPYHSYSDGYDHAGTLLDWIQNNGHPGFIRNLNIAIHDKTYTNATYFTSQTGKTVDQLWTAMTGKPITSGQVKSSAYTNICLDDWASGTTDGNKIDNYTCNGSDAQHVYRLAQSDGSSFLKIFGSCLDDKSSGTADGNPVQLWGCNGSDAQKWKINSNKTITNVVSGKCLYNDGGNTTLATQLTIKTCNATDPRQQWSTP